MTSAVATDLPEDCARRFRFERALSEGGFGVVCIATQVALDRRVAVKVLRSGGAGLDVDERARFEQEARLTASLDHPNIVRLIDHGAETGVPWIAYELLEGSSLRSRLTAQGPLPVAVAVTATLHVARALQAAHGAGILHRDIKPDNVIDDGAGVFKVIDLGIAKVGLGSSIATQTGVLLGSPGYMAPEVIAGSSPGVRSDLYALGIMLYELLAGRLPYESDDPIVLLQRHLSGRHTPVEELRPEVPPALARVVRELLARDPRGRPGDASALIWLLEALESPVDAPASMRTQVVLGGAPSVKNLTRSVNAASVPGRRASQGVVATSAVPAPSGSRRLAGALLAVMLCLGSFSLMVQRRPTPAPVLALLPPRWNALVEQLSVDTDRLRAVVDERYVHGSGPTPRQRSSVVAQARQLARSALEAARTVGSGELEDRRHAAFCLILARARDLLSRMYLPSAELPELTSLEIWAAQRDAWLLAGLRRTFRGVPPTVDGAIVTINLLQQADCYRLASLRVEAWWRSVSGRPEHLSRLTSRDWETVAAAFSSGLDGPMYALQSDLKMCLDREKLKPQHMYDWAAANNSMVRGWMQFREKALSERRILKKASLAPDLRLRCRSMLTLWTTVYAPMVEVGLTDSPFAGQSATMAAFSLSKVVDSLCPELGPELRRDVHERRDRSPKLLPWLALATVVCGPDASCTHWVADGAALLDNLEKIWPPERIKTSFELWVVHLYATAPLDMVMERVIGGELTNRAIEEKNMLTMRGSAVGNDIKTLLASGWLKDALATARRWIDFARKNPTAFAQGNDLRSDSMIHPLNGAKLAQPHRSRRERPSSGPSRSR